MEKDIALIIGNGFSLNFSKFHKMERFNDTQNPSKWNLPGPTGEKFLIDAFPEMKKLLLKKPNVSDFDIFEEAVKIYNQKKQESNYVDFYWSASKKRQELRINDDFKKDIIPIECRHFLCLAFSAYSLETKKLLDKSWPWYSWLRTHMNRISAICSYNYDLILEQSLQKMCTSYYNETTPAKAGKILLYKPHGSCNYEITAIFAKPRYPITSYFDNNDAPIKELRYDELFKPRISPLCVIPNQRNIYSHFLSMKPQNKAFNLKLNRCNFLIILGHSYADVDTPEIDDALYQLRFGTKVIIANPCPPPKLIEKIRELGLEVHYWDNYLGPLDAKGNLITI